MVEGQNIGKFLKELRIERNMTEQEVAEAVDVPQLEVINWERGQSRPDVSLLPDLATLFDISIDELLEGNRHGVDYPQVSEEERFASVMSYGKSVRGDRLKSVRQQLLLLISIVMLVIIATTIVIEFLTVNRLSWSLLVAVSIVLAWGTIVPLFLPLKKPLITSLITFTILTIPYFFLLDQILNLEGLLRNIAIPCAIAVFIFAWGMYFVYKYLNFNRLQLVATALFGVLLVTIVVNITLSAVVNAPYFTVSNILSFIILVALGAGALYLDYRNKQTPPEE